MADPDVQKFNKAVEKACVDAASDVHKLLSNCRNSIGSRMSKFTDAIEGLDIPEGADLSKVPALVSTVLKRESAKFDQVITLNARVEVSGGKLKVPMAGASGALSGV